MSSISGMHVRGRKNVKKGVGFTIMVCGASGTGRTTFVNTLCERPVLDHKEPVEPQAAHIDEPMDIVSSTVEMDSEGTRIALTVVDTPGFGDLIDNEPCFGKILGYLERQYDEILAEESRIKRNPRFRDNRVHVLLYFIEPTGHGLRNLDIELMRRLAPRVNIIPVIGKADSLTPTELSVNKKLIMDDIDHYEIPIYNFPYDIEEDDEETVEENAELRGLLPFAVVGAEDVVVTPDGGRVRARRYPWGIVDVENPEHSDFMALRSALLQSHLGDLKEITHDFLYENYRTEKLSRTTEDGAAEDSATQAMRLKEEQIRREEEKLRNIEMQVQRELAEKRAQLQAKEEALRNLESRLEASSQAPSE